MTEQHMTRVLTFDEVRVQLTHEVDLQLVAAAERLCGRCINRLLQTGQKPSLDAVGCAEITAASAWIEVQQRVHRGELRGFGSRERGYRKIIKALRNYRIEYDPFEKVKHQANFQSA